MILYNHRITIREAADDIVRLMSSNLYGCFRHERAAAKIAPELLNFQQKQRRMEDVDDVQRLFRFAQNGHNCRQIISNVHE